MIHSLAEFLSLLAGVSNPRVPHGPFVPGCGVGSWRHPFPSRFSGGALRASSMPGSEGKELRCLDPGARFGLCLFSPCSGQRDIALRGGRCLRRSSTGSSSCHEMGTRGSPPRLLLLPRARGAEDEHRCSPSWPTGHRGGGAKGGAAPLRAPPRGLVTPQPSRERRQTQDLCGFYRFQQPRKNGINRDGEQRGRRARDLPKRGAELPRHWDEKAFNTCSS